MAVVVSHCVSLSWFLNKAVLVMSQPRLAYTAPMFCAITITDFKVKLFFAKEKALAHNDHYIKTGQIHVNARIVLQL